MAAEGRIASMPVAESVKEIWVENAEEAFEIIQRFIGNEGGTLLVGLDTEFCRQDFVSDPRGIPTSAEMHYQQACRNVNGGDLLQVGLAFAKEGVFQFNLFFDESTRSSENKTLIFLKDVAKLPLDDFRNRGIPFSQFFHLMRKAGLLANQSLVWITYQGYCDFGYLIRGIEGVSVLPQSRGEFLNIVQSYFPKICDIKILHELGVCCKRPPPLPRPKGTGGLQGMAGGLRVDRIAQAHGAGSDAHLTLSCYNTMALSSPRAAALIGRFSNRLYGVSESSMLNWDDEQATEIKVCRSTFGSEATLFSKLFCNSQPVIVSVEAEFPNGADFNSSPISYAKIRTEAALSGPATISFGVSDISGCLLFGRIWSFKVGSRKDCVEPSEFAKMLTQCEVVLNPNVIWCSSSSVAYAYLTKALSSNCLPPKLQAYFSLSAAIFPKLTVLNVIPETRTSHRALITLRQFETLTRQHREGPVGWCDPTE